MKKLKKLKAPTKKRGRKRTSSIPDGEMPDSFFCPHVQKALANSYDMEPKENALIAFLVADTFAMMQPASRWPAPYRMSEHGKRKLADVFLAQYIRDPGLMSELLVPLTDYYSEWVTRGIRFEDSLALWASTEISPPLSWREIARRIFVVAMKTDSEGQPVSEATLSSVYFPRARHRREKILSKWRKHLEALKRHPSEGGNFTTK